jgi:hypothetical protein
VSVRMSNVRADTAGPWTHSSVHADAAGPSFLPPLPPSSPSLLSLPPLPPPASRPHRHSLLFARTGCVRTDTRIFLFFYFYFILVVVASWKRKKIIIRFLVFNPQVSQDPQDPQDPQALQALRAKPREEKDFFGLVPLVTHPSSIPLLGGLTPKFLSLSFHSL